MTRRIPFLFTATLAVLALTTSTQAQVTSDVPAIRPDAIVDLASDEGVSLVRGQWRYSDARVVEVDHRSPGTDLRPSGPPNRTYDIVPRAGVSSFDDSTWQTIDPRGLEARRSTGRLSFGWYRIAVTIPEKVGALDTSGSTVVFEIVVDDYAEVWVDGQLPVGLGQAGGQLIKGFNAPNRVVIARDAVPGQRIQLAVFGANGPLSNPPGNFVWVRSATLDFYKKGRIGKKTETKADIRRINPGLDEIVPDGLTIEKLADGFVFTEGPVWVPEGLPSFQRSERKHDLQVGARRPGLRLSDQERVLGCRRRRVRAAGIQRHHA